MPRRDGFELCEKLPCGMKRDLGSRSNINQRYYLKTENGLAVDFTLMDALQAFVEKKQQASFVDDNQFREAVGY